MTVTYKGPDGVRLGQKMRTVGLVCVEVMKDVRKGSLAKHFEPYTNGMYLK